MPAPAEIDRAARLLLDGRLVGMPTETVYGLAADATNPAAVAAVFAAKGRPAINPLIAHVPDMEAARRLAIFNPQADRLAAAFWPGGLTLVLPRTVDCPVDLLACAGLTTIAVRVPDHPVAQALLRATGRPLAAPSANRSGRPSPTLAAHVQADLGDAIAMVLDAGPAQVGLESTVVRVDGSGVIVLRDGAVTRDALRGVARAVTDVGAFDPAAPPSPGMILRHYAPVSTMRLEAAEAAPGGILLGFGPVSGVGPDGGADPAWSLSPVGDVVEAASRLFALIRSADAQRPTQIAVAPVPDAGLGAAINDRLRRAAASQA
ncbi:MAG: L-threonylcarbamoyladenylate synthase [Hyphomonadaceae bacterium]|nr:L-threonylcarbamoyladenylate synthase [Hyphomonadaceae bacterium]